MNILILYATRGGATKTCAEQLAKRLKAHHTPILRNVCETLPSPQDYDAVILGGSIRMGKLDKRLKAYMKQHLDTLSAMPCAVFICCGYPRQFEEYAEIQIPKHLQLSLGVHCFGGELKPEKLHGIDRLIIRMMRNAIRGEDFEESDADHHALPELIPENIELLVDRIEKIR